MGLVGVEASQFRYPGGACICHEKIFFHGLILLLIAGDVIQEGRGSSARNIVRNSPIVKYTGTLTF